MMNIITLGIQPTRHLRKIIILIMLFSVTLLFTACGGTGESQGASDSKNVGLSDGKTASVAEQTASQNAAPSEVTNSYSPFPFTFTTEDLYGNTVTEESLGDKRLFFIHYWATWCGPCMQEMPELAKIAKNYENNVGFIGLVGDYGSNLSGAKRIAESVGIPSSFIMVDAEAEDMEALLSMVQTGYIPTTAIIDGNGELLAESPLVGSYGEGYAEILDSLLE